MTTGSSLPVFWAHTHPTETRRQALSAHLFGVETMAGEYARKFGAESFARIAGRLHDAGKYTEAFQARLDGSAKRVDHATAGAKICLQSCRNPFGAMAIMGHHGGLLDMGSRTDVAGTGTFMSRLKKDVEESVFERVSREIGVPEPLTAPVPFTDVCREWEHAEGITFGRMLYSCLVDADFCDTAAFVGEPREGVSYNAQLILDLTMRHLDSLARGPASVLNAERQRILQACLVAARGQRGLYNLTVPTGGGKTLAGLAFAASHARLNGLERIIYVAPYTSIIDQTARTFRQILGSEIVLEHHHGVEYDESDILHRHAVENWDMPIIVTTAVQFFESLYSNKPSRCRKLHNIANSVVIIDEVQTLPESQLQACVFGVSELVKRYSATVLLCTATQPALNALFCNTPLGVEPTEICTEADFSSPVFKRAAVVMDREYTTGELASQLAQHNQVLCIVNRRQSAYDVFSSLTGDGTERESFHLSTLMTPFHRASALTEIRQRLSLGMPCRVVATNLIEAGVDIDFPAVYREEASLDSIVQSAGRCNREGHAEAVQSIVRVFRLGAPPLDMQRQISVTRQTMERFEDCMSRDAITYYYENVRNAVGLEALDKSGVFDLTKNGQGRKPFPYAAIAERFHLIDDTTMPIYVPYAESVKLIEALRNGERSRKLFRSLDVHTVPVYRYQASALVEAGAIEVFDQGAFGVLLTENDSTLYTDRTGLRLSV